MLTPPDRMKAVTMSRYGDIDVLETAEVAMPVPRPGEALVRVRAAAVNPADVKWRAGQFASFAPVGFPHILGYDVAGEIVFSARFGAGARVVAMLDPFRKGGYAEYAAVAEDALVLIPDALDFAAAAAIPTPGLTGLQLVEQAANVRSGDRVLISGATGAVGRFAIWAARQRGARVIAAVRAERTALARSLGAHEMWLAPPIETETTKANCLIDTIGGADAARLGGSIHPDGSIFTVATTPIPVGEMPVEPIFYAVHPNAAQLERLVAAVGAGEIELPSLHRIGFDDLRLAHRQIEDGGFAGRLVLEP